MIKSNTLYIIGNGFDLHHGVKSSYSYFQKYVKNKDKELYDILEEYFSPELWSDFETTLAHLDIESISDNAGNYLMSYGDPNWSDAGHHDYQYEIDKIVTLVTERLRQRFTEWILLLEQPNRESVIFLDLDKTSTYINFNYTPTLERVYRIPRANIFHIHNKAESLNSKLILGHNRNPKTIPTVSDEDTDVRIAEGERILNSYFKRTYKSTSRVIADNQAFFKSLSSTDTIYVLGHSLAPVDMGYFIEIAKNIENAKVKWVISYRGAEQISARLEALTGIGIDRNLISFIEMPELALNKKIQTQLKF